MSFFGAVFASLTLYWQWHLSGTALALPFAGFALIWLAANYVIRRPGEGIKPTPKEERAIMWSSIGERIELLLASNVVINLHRPDLLLPSMALVVGLHFLPIAFAAAFRPFYVLGMALIIAASVGLMVRAPTGSEVAGFMAAGALWVAAGIAVRRDWLAKAGKVARADQIPAQPSSSGKPIVRGTAAIDNRSPKAVVPFTTTFFPLAARNDTSPFT